jgi:hypothetical protein
MSALPIATARAAISRANSQHSTGPPTAAGKQRSSLNALRHGLTTASPVPPPKTGYMAIARQSEWSARLSGVETPNPRDNHHLSGATL